MKFNKLAFLLLTLLSLMIVSCGDDEDPAPTPDCSDDCQFTVDTYNEATGMCENVLVIPTCDDSDPNTDDSFVESDCRCDNIYKEGITNYVFFENEYSPEAVQSAMILMETGDTITFGPGTFEFPSTLSLDDKDGVLIIGAGIDETTLDFTNQTIGAEGIKVTATNSILANFTVLNAIGDGIKAKDCEAFSFINVAAVWDGEPDTSNGAYGLYPVSSTNLLLDGCYARGASDAGIYVGQCVDVHVRNCTAELNVAGIEIENTSNADVYDNVAINNTGGLIIFDLPDLPAGQGRSIRAWNNRIEGNNYRNYAEAGNVVSQVPPGTGVMIMAAADVEVFDNEIINNNLMSIGLVDYEVLKTLGSADWDDPNYITYPRGIYLHDNSITRTNDCPEDLNTIGGIIEGFFDNCEIPEILWDGVTNFDNISSDETRICVSNSGNIVDLDLANWPGAQELVYDNTPFDCVRDPLPPAEISAPEL